MKRKCQYRRMQCSHSPCDWEGSAIDFASHELVCPFVNTACEWCCETMPQYQMPGHSCPFVPGDLSCISCFRTFDELLSVDDVKPAVLLKDGQRCCVHPGGWSCVTCAAQWLSNATCMLCRQPFNSVHALPDHLVVCVSAADPATEASTGDEEDGTFTTVDRLSSKFRNKRNAQRKGDGYLGRSPASNLPREDRSRPGFVHWVSLEKLHHRNSWAGSSRQRNLKITFS